MGGKHSVSAINRDNNWVHSNPSAPLPPFAVFGGYVSDGTPIYVGRAFHLGEFLPAKVIPNKACAYISWEGAEYKKTQYEVLVGIDYSWIPFSGGKVPPNAVSSDATRIGESLFVGRGHHANCLTVGKIQPSHDCLYIPFGGKEIKVSTYEVLVKNKH